MTLTYYTVGRKRQGQDVAARHVAVQYSLAATHSTLWLTYAVPPTIVQQARVRVSALLYIRLVHSNPQQQ